MSHEIRNSHRVRAGRLLDGLVGPLLGSLVLGFGCGVEAPATYRDYALQSAQISCQRAFRCCNRQCSPTADANFNKTIENTQFAIDTGLAEFNLAQAQACLDAQRAIYTDCTQYVGLVDTSQVSEACSNILIGKLPLGAACSTTNDYCQPGNYCATDNSLMPPQQRCRRLVNVGEMCDGTVRCVKGSTCDVGGSNLCRATPPVAKFGEACGAMTACATSLTCLPDMTCGLPQEGGKSCTGNAQCLSNRCAIDTCTVAMTKPPTVSDMVCGP